MQVDLHPGVQQGIIGAVAQPRTAVKIVITQIAEQDIVAAVTVQQVIATIVVGKQGQASHVVAIERVIADAAGHYVVPIAARKNVIAGTARQLVYRAIIRIVFKCHDGMTIQPVIAVAAVQLIRPGISGHLVVALFTIGIIVAKATRDQISIIAATKHIIAATPEQLIIPAAANQGITGNLSLGAVAKQTIIPRAAIEVVEALAAIKKIVACVADQAVIILVTAHHIVAGTAEQRIVALATIQEVNAAEAGEHVAQQQPIDFIVSG
ncbi:MAG: hypothetical protein WCS20_10260 [Alphaproteobacteria bacterium]